jgi:hypothetical protein
MLGILPPVSFFTFLGKCVHRLTFQRETGKSAAGGTM